VKAFFGFVRDHAAELLAQTYEHLLLTVVAVALSILVGLPAGLWLTRRRRMKGLVLGLAGVVQTIPSLALLGFLIPLTGIGAAPAVVALFLYALLPIVRNTVTGVEGVQAAVKEAAVGMGMTDWEVLRKVELPLATPSILAGIRTATVVSVGVATLAALIGGGGLGVYVFRGISLANTAMLLAGAVPAALLALSLDAALGVVERRVAKLFLPMVAVLVGLVVAIAGQALVRGFRPSTRVRIGAPAEFMERPDGYPGLATRYGLDADVVEMDHGLMYRAVADGRVDAVIGYSTDGEIAAMGLRVLDDDRSYFPPYYAAPLARKALLHAHPEIRAIFDRLSGRLSASRMASLNARAEHGGEPAERIADDFLRAEGFEPGPHRRGAPADVVIGSKIFAEQYILAEIFASLVESYTPLRVDLKIGLGGTKICFEALKRGEIDLYPEYTGTGLLAILDVPKETRQALVGDAQRVYDYVRREFESRFSLVWLAPLGFDNRYAVVIPDKTANRLGVTTTSALIDRFRPGRRAPGSF
jgi:glycine betaine/choline ABC-type transport system substrate-binding protein/ABC-type proline/glycine betaine transport system permease subunit